MKLYKDIFKITEDNLKFLLYLSSHPKFLLSDVSEKFNLGYAALFNHLREWEAKGYILKERLPPKLGGKKYEYSLSEKAIKKLEKILETASSELKK